jgi:protein phosphatase
MATQSAGQSDVGRKRLINEDSFHCDDALGFYVVADGVGGHSKGEVASQEAVEQLRMWVRGRRKELEALRSRVGQGDEEAHWEIRRLLENGVQSACYMVFSMAELDPDKRGMSTTMSCALIGGGTCYAAHVGDSRVYRVRDGQVLQITEDHTLINYKLKQGLITPEEAAKMSGRNVITRAVGHKDYVQVDTADVDARAGDRFMLCTDGMHGYLDDEREVAELIGEGALETGVAAAVALANQRGGKDNITVIAVEVFG